MDFDREIDLENAGIDAFEFSLMDEDEKVEALEEAGLDPADYDMIEFDSSFSAWSDLQNAGLNLFDIELMDDEEKREALEDAGLNPDDYDGIGLYNLHSYSSPIITPNQSRTYRYIQVQFSNSETIYSYRADGYQINIGDNVEVPVGRDNHPTFAKVISVGDYSAGALPYPLEKTKAILRKVPSFEIPTGTEAPSCSAKEGAVSKGNCVSQVETPKPEQEAMLQVSKASVSTAQMKMPVYYTQPAKKKRHTGAILALASAFIFLALIWPKQSSSSTSNYSSTHTTNRSTSSTYGSSSSYTTANSSIPACPPVNRERAMTKEEAEKLSGTGYHGTRPNSSAENIELSAAQVKCKNCGYRSHNGRNSLCDYCSWMERYGGGLPPAATPTPKATPKTTTRPQSTAKPDSDPFHASDYGDADDFYYDYYDDFWDFEDAEDYWIAHR